MKLFKKEYLVDPNRCVCCYQCINVCPTKALTKSATGSVEFNLSRCIRCGACKRTCKSKALVCRRRFGLFQREKRN